MNNRMFLKGGSAADYHAMPGYGSSALRCFALDGPLEFYACYVSRKKVAKDSDARRLGRGFHLGMECPDHWKDAIVRVPTTIREDDFYHEVLAELHSRGSKGKIPKPGSPVNLRCDFDSAYIGRFQQLADVKGCDFLNDDQIELVERQIDACWDNPAIREILERKCQHEVPCTLQFSHFTLKALLDLLVVDSCFYDFKTTRANNPYRWWWEYKKNGYGFQIATYQIVTGIHEHGLIYVHNTDPVEAQIMDVPESLIQKELDDVQRHCEWLDQHLGTVDMSAVDSQGIPLEFHNEPWGTVIDPEEMFLNSSLGLEIEVDDEEGVTA